jgi:hypothetical protein
MSKQRDDKILVHVAGPLKVAVTALAETDGRSVSDYVRRLLIDHVQDRALNLSEVDPAFGLKSPHMEAA